MRTLAHRHVAAASGKEQCECGFDIRIFRHIDAFLSLSHDKRLAGDFMVSCRFERSHRYVVLRDKVQIVGLAGDGGNFVGRGCKVNLSGGCDSAKHVRTRFHDRAFALFCGTLQGQHAVPRLYGSRSLLDVAGYFADLGQIVRRVLD